MHDMFSRRQAGVAIATGVGHKPGGDGIFDWLSGDRRDHGEEGGGAEQNGTRYRSNQRSMKSDFLQTLTGLLVEVISRLVSLSLLVMTTYIHHIAS